MPSGVYERTPEHREQIRAQRLGSKASEETKARMRAAKKGKVISPEQRAKISATLTGRKRPPKVVEKVATSLRGRKASPEHRANISAANAGRFTKDEHHGWKGDEVSYSALHWWLRRNFPKSGACEDCGKEGKTDYAFLRHPEPHTRDRSDYRELCRSCHQKLDRNG